MLSRVLYSAYKGCSRAHSAYPQPSFVSSPFQLLQARGLVQSTIWRSTAIADLCDAYLGMVKSGEVRVLEPIFNIYGTRRIFSGPVATLKSFEDNVLLREILETKGEGRVLVIDGGGSRKRPLLGGILAQLAHNMNWAGLVIDGCVRDVDDINSIDIGLRAIGSNPLKPGKMRTGEKDIPVSVGGTLIFPGEWLYADSDGVIISKTELTV